MKASASFHLSRNGKLFSDYKSLAAGDDLGEADIEEIPRNRASLAQVKTANQVPVVSVHPASEDLTCFVCGRKAEYSLDVFVSPLGAADALATDPALIQEIELLVCRGCIDPGRADTWSPDHQEFKAKLAALVFGLVCDLRKVKP